MSTSIPISDLKINKLFYDQYENVVDGNTYDNTQIYEIKDISNVFCTQNGTISNCILEIPQNIKVELANNVLTLKVGSILTRTGDTYSTVTTTEDKTQDFSSYPDSRYVCCAGRTSTNINYVMDITKVGSGDTLPADDSTYSWFFLTTDKLIYYYKTSDSTWVDRGITYPFTIIDVVNGVASFAKDSNGNNMIFNGAGFVGTEVFLCPGVKALKAIGIANDGKLLSKQLIGTEFKIMTLLQNHDTIMLYNHGSDHSYTGTRRKYYETYDPTLTTNQTVQYDSNGNNMYYSQIAGDTPILANDYVPFISYTNNNDSITNFTIYQPFRLGESKNITYRQW